MKRTLLLAMALAAPALCGCSMSSRGGGIDHDRSFRIIGPAATTVKQGEVAIVTLKLNRGDSFKRDVRLDLRPSDGLDVEPTEATIAANEEASLQVRISAPRDAAIGEYHVYVKGTPETGEPTSMDFVVKVEAP